MLINQNLGRSWELIPWINKVNKQIELEQTFNFELAQETPGQALTTVREPGGANMEMDWFVPWCLGLIVWLTRAWRSGDLSVD